MPVTTELATLHQRVGELRTIIDSLLERYGDIPAVRRLLGDIERIDLDACELDSLTPRDTPLAGAATVAPAEIQRIDDTPHDPSLWADADDEGLGGYQR